MAKFLLILIAGLIFEAIGVVRLSEGLKQIGEIKQINVTEIIRVIKDGATNQNILVGILFEAIFFGVLLYLLSQRDVSLIWPLTALGFVITAIAAKIRLHEEVSPLRWTGIVLIVLGAALVSWSEKKKETSQANPPPTTSAESNLR